MREKVCPLAARLSLSLGGFFVNVMVYEAFCQTCGYVEIQKSMRAAFPERHTCGSALTRVYTAPVIFYNAEGFKANEKRFRAQVGDERANQFERRKQAIQHRAAQGQLTEYERRLDALPGTTD